MTRQSYRKAAQGSMQSTYFWRAVALSTACEAASSR